MNELSLEPARLESVKNQPDGSIRAACPACRAVGSDKSGNHLLIEPSGKFGCAKNPGDGPHRQEIFKLVGIKSEVPSKPRIVATYDYQDAAGKLLFQVVRFEPKDFRQRQPDGKGGWVWNTKGLEKVLFRLPEILDAISGSKIIFNCEGEKDALAMVKHGLIATCNPGGAGKWQDNFTETLRGADVAIVADKDPAGRAHAQLVASKLNGAARSVRIIELPDTNGKPVKDAHDFFAASGDAGQIGALVDAAPEWTSPAAPDLPETPASRFTIRTPDEILSMVFDDSDIILGDRIVAEGQSCVIAGAGGLGKSRLIIQMAACVSSGRQFLNFDASSQNRNWLILQTENSNRRLQADLLRVKPWLGNDWSKFADRVRFHTVETDTDSFVNLDSLEAVGNIESAIEAHKPDIIVIDPLNDFAIGDLNKDADMKFTLQSLSRVCRKGNPRRAIIVLHHALTGKAGMARATGYDRASFGRNSKTLHAWTRAQINLAPVDPDTNDRLVIACGKCSNGKEFQPFAVRLNIESMIYEVDSTVDVSQWEQDVTGAKDTTPLMNSDRVRELCSTAGSDKAELAKAITTDCGCARQSAYRYIARAEKAKKITFNKSNETYFRK